MKLMEKIILLILISSIASESINVCVESNLFSDENFKLLIEEIDKSFPIDSTRFLAKIVRLTFHDCVSGCNGCIDEENIDNKGLNGAVSRAARIYWKFGKKLFWNKYKLSRADIYALMGFRAIYVGSKFPGLTLPTCEFRIGRKDCTGPQDNKEIFSRSIANWEEILKFYQTEFKYNIKEIVALMGAHTLGQTCNQNSGHNGAWVAHDFAVFSNAYYKNMIDKNLNYKSSKGVSKQQWMSFNGKHPTKPVKVMLNADMCMLKKFNINQEGVPDCTYETCQTNSEPAEWVERYATNEPLFKEEFSKVYKKMLEHGYEDTDTLIDIIPNTYTNNVKIDYSIEIRDKIWNSFEILNEEENFKIYHFIYRKKYNLVSEEGHKRFEIFKKNLNFIKNQYSESSDINPLYSVNSYTDMSFEEYFKEKFRVNPIHLEEFEDLDIDINSHLLKDA